MTRKITIPAGTVLVLDIKTGALKLIYWNKYSPQCATYAAAVPYDPETDTRGEWPWPIDQDVALIAHIPVADLLATGRCDISLVPVDLAAGRHAAELCVAAKAWNARRDIFGTPVPVVTAEVAPPAVDGDPFDGLTSTLGETYRPATATPIPEEEFIDWHAPGDDRARPRLQDRAATLKATHPDAAKWVAARWPQGVPPLKGDAPLTDADLDAIDAVLASAEAHFAAPFGDHDMTRPTPTAKPVDPPKRATWQRPEEGPTVDDTIVKEAAELRRRYPSEAALVESWLGQAIAAGRPLKPPDGRRTVRTAKIYRAMVDCSMVADFIHNGCEMLRHIIGLVRGADPDEFGSVAVGAGFGSLTIAQAEQLNTIARRYDAGEVTVAFDPSGAPIIVPLAA